MAVERPLSGRVDRLAARIERAWVDGGPLQWALRPLAWLNGAIVGLRRTLYRAGCLRSESVDVPVVVIGNRVIGGAGKTPTTLALVEALREAGWHPGIVSRGHGGSGTAPRPVLPDSLAAEVGDEPLLMRRRSGVPVFVGRDRVAAARALRQAHPVVDLIVCDDGLQHLRLRRDVEVVVFDERGAGSGWLLPAGPLREPIDAPAAAPQVVLYNASRVSTAQPGHLARRELSGLLLLADWWAGRTPPPGVPTELQGRVVLASAGIGQPARFFEALRALGLVVDPWPLPDHDRLDPLPWPTSASDVVVTEKDAVKLPLGRVRAERPGLRIWVAPLQFTLPPGFVDAVRVQLPEMPARPSRPSSD